MTLGRFVPAALAAVALSLAATSVVFGHIAAQEDTSRPFGANAIAAMSTRRAVAAQVARDGYPPTATPTPVPPPPPFADCYGPRRGDAGAAVLRPAPPESLFANCQVVAYYGYPGVPALGVLAQSEPATMLTRLAAEVAAHDAANGPRRAIPALEIIAAVAQATAQADRSYLYRIPFDLLDAQLAFAEEHDLLVVLDIQVGHSTVEAEVGRLLPYLGNPRVHLALDPEWAMPPGVVPGSEIGGLEASAINRAQELISTHSREHRLRTNKVLVVHQFEQDMILHKDQLAAYPGVELLVDMDGFGGQGIKIAHYNRYVGEDGAPHGGIKLFYKDDVNLMDAAQVAALVPQPDFVVYQ